MLASSYELGTLLLVYSTALPPGSTCGHDCATSLAPSGASATVGPPSADTRHSRAPALRFGENTMVLSLLHVPPRCSGTAARTTGTPPVTATFFTPSPEKKPIHWPSGEK